MLEVNKQFDKIMWKMWNPVATKSQNNEWQIKIQIKMSELDGALMLEVNKQFDKIMWKMWNPVATKSQNNEWQIKIQDS